MARSARSPQLETRTARLKLSVAKKPVFVRIGPKIGLGYRRNQSVGTWVARVADGSGGNWTKAIGTADDLEDADGNHVLDFWQAQEKARALGRNDRGTNSRPITVGEALSLYQADLRMRGRDPDNLMRVNARLPPSLREKPVALLAAADLRRWRDKLAEVMVPASVNRTIGVLRAALNLAAEQDERIVNRGAWVTGLAVIRGAQRSRNVILDEAEVRRIIVEAYRVRDDFGLLVEVAAVTGARISQLARLEVQDVQADRANPRLLMPTSHKGSGVKEVTRRPVPIPTGLGARLQDLAADRPPDAPLLVQQRRGAAWTRNDHSKLFRRAAKAAGHDPAEVTIYALRHSNIVRQLLAGVPIRVVAVNHDTSVTMIERTYSRYIADHADVLARGALLDTSAPPGGNIVPIRATGAVE